MIPYILLLFTVLLFSFLDYKVKENKNIFFIITLIIIALFSGLRNHIGWDFNAYYDTIAYGIETNVYSKREWLNFNLINLTRSIYYPQFYFIFTAFLSTILIGITILKYSKNKWISIYVYLTFPLFFLNSMSVIRNFVAISIVVYSIKYIIDKKLVRFVIAVILAAGFHQSAYIALLLYPLSRLKLNKKLYLLILVIIPLMKNLLLVGMYKILPYYYIYLRETSNREGRFAIIVILLIFVTILLLDKKMIYNNLHNKFFNFYFFGCLIYIMYYKFGTLGHRLSLYGTIYMIFIVPYFINNLSNKTKILAKMVLWTVFFLFYLYTIIRGSETYIPYTTVLQW